MKYLQVLCVLFCTLLLGQGFSMLSMLRQPSGGKQQQQHFVQLSNTRIPEHAKKVGLDLCPTCISFTEQSINNLLNIILNVGLIGTCGELCSILEQETGSQILGAVCNILCDIAGFEEFVKILNKADLDPIYFCELLKSCPINDNGDAKITSFTITPKSGPQGTTFNLDLAYTSKNGTGTGEIFLGCETVDHMPVAGLFLREAQGPGSYDNQFSLKTRPNPDCDPVQDFCEEWLPGNYSVRIDLCNGECGSKHPHSEIYDRARVNFTITGE